MTITFFLFPVVLLPYVETIVLRLYHVLPIWVCFYCHAKVLACLATVSRQAPFFPSVSQLRFSSGSGIPLAEACGGGRDGGS